MFREAGSGTREVIANYLLEQGLTERELTNSLELGSPEAVKGAVEAGMGVSIVSRAIISKELKLGTLVALQPGAAAHPAVLLRAPAPEVPAAGRWTSCSNSRATTASVTRAWREAPE